VIFVALGQQVFAIFGPAMSEIIKHECGIAVLRLLKPLSYYKEKYGTPLYGINKMYLLMEKMHNRGQDGAGLANIKLNVEPGNRYISRRRSIKSQPIQHVFKKINKRFQELIEKDKEKFENVDWLQRNMPYTGEVFIGHLRYGTYGKYGIESCHPFLRQNNWQSRNLIVAGNFNLTNVDELFQNLIDLGQHPKEKADTVTIMERIGHFLDEENEELYWKFKQAGYSKKEISPLIAEHLDLKKILQRAFKKFDGGYVIGGLIGHGDSFVVRDPSGIRPAYWYQDEEVVVVCSERPIIQTAFNVDFSQIKEVKPGHAVIVKKNGEVSEEEILPPQEIKPCSFERIYFSRGSDAEIYRERKELGRLICDDVLKEINYDLENTVFSFIPNTAEVAFYGMVKGMEDYLTRTKKEQILALGNDITPEKLESILSFRPRVEKMAIKDAKLRTFITDDSHRDDLVQHVYDITYETVRKGVDTIVLIDDSIVRGTTLKKSILKILDRLGPKKIIIVSSAPQIRYPDCYGIDMAKLKDFVAFRAAIELLIERGNWYLTQEVLAEARAQLALPLEQCVNVVKKIYEPFTYQEISDKIAELLKPNDIKAEVKIIYQTVENLHAACPNHRGDWYFTGDYPTPGGNRVVNKSFINYMEGRDERAY
jgi:amidophosphoribosyltransferase